MKQTECTSLFNSSRSCATQNGLLQLLSFSSWTRGISLRRRSGVFLLPSASPNTTVYSHILFFFFLSLIFFAGPQTYEDCSVYIKEKFMSLNENREKPIYAHFTCATDTENIIVVFNAVRDIILSKTLKVIGMPIWVIISSLIYCNLFRLINFLSFRHLREWCYCLSCFAWWSPVPANSPRCK